MAKVHFVDVCLESGTEEAVFRIPLNRNGTLSEILPLPPGTKIIRIDFPPEASTLHFEELRVIEVSELERILRLLDRVWRFDAGTLLEIPFADRLSKLHGLYARVREHRLDRLGWNSYEVFLNAVEAPQIDHKWQHGLDVASRRCLSNPAVFKVYLSEGSSEARQRTLESLISQTYPHWQLASEHAQCSGLADWIFPLRAGDILRRDALQQFARAADAAPAATVIYSDHDFMGVDGRRHTPAFKPDWNLDLFHTHNYLADPCVFRIAACLQHTLEESAFLNEALRYQLILQLADSGPRAIHHVPQVLCHRQSPVDSEHTLGFKAQPEILQRHLAHSGAVVHAGHLPGTTRVLWPLPNVAPLVSIIVATRDQCLLLEACIRSLQTKTTYPDWELIVLDNQSADPITHSFFDKLRGEPKIRILSYPKPFNYSALQNFGAAHSRGEVLVFLNNDVEVLSPNWLEDLLRHVLRPDVGAVGARLLYSDGSIQHAGLVLGIGGVAGHVHRFFPGQSPGYCGRIQLTQELSAVTAACLSVRKTAFEAVGGFDDRHLKIAFNDVDLCLKLAAHGLRNIYEPAVLLYHHESVSRGPDDTPRKRWISSREERHMFSRWKDQLKRDRCYNENLTHHFEDYRLRVKDM